MKNRYSRRRFYNLWGETGNDDEMWRGSWTKCNWIWVLADSRKLLQNLFLNSRGNNWRCCSRNRVIMDFLSVFVETNIPFVRILKNPELIKIKNIFCCSSGVFQHISQKFEIPMYAAKYLALIYPYIRYKWF